MKLKEGLFLCPPCNMEIRQNVNRVSGNGRKGVAVAMVTCPKCLNMVSQKTRMELDKKYERI